jgi:hypothetical protein
MLSAFGPAAMLISIAHLDPLRRLAISAAEIGSALAYCDV